MSNLGRVALVVSLLTCGIWAGIVFTYAIERVNLWARMPLPQYVIDFRRSLFRIDPLQPILAIVSILAAVVFALNTRGVSAALTWSAIGLIALVIIMSIALPERINSLFRRRPEGEAPPDVETLRSRWRTLRYLRTAPTIAAFLALALAAAWV